MVLHGHSSTPEVAAALADELDPDGRLHHVAPEGPLVAPDGTRAWFSDDHGSLAGARTVVRALLEGLVEDGGAPVVVIGYSQGAAASLAALADPWRGPMDGLLGVAVLSGFLAEARGVDQDLGALAGVPVLVQHGRSDDVVPDFFAADLVASLEGVGADVTADWFDMGHEHTADSVASARRWLAAAVLRGALER